MMNRLNGIYQTIFVVVALLGEHAIIEGKLRGTSIVKSVDDAALHQHFPDLVAKLRGSDKQDWEEFLDESEYDDQVEEVSYISTMTYF